MCHLFLPTPHIFGKGGIGLDKTVLGKRIREARLSKGYAQQGLDAKAGIGGMYMGGIERGVKMPSINIFIKIIETLEVSADSILRDELTSGQVYIYDEITEKLKNLTPKQRKTATDILNAYLQNL